MWPAPLDSGASKSSVGSTDCSESCSGHAFNKAHSKFDLWNLSDMRERTCSSDGGLQHAYSVGTF